MSSVLNSKKSIDRSIAAEQLPQQLSALFFSEGTLFLSKQISSSSSHRISASRTGLLARKGTARNLSWFRASYHGSDLYRRRSIMRFFLSTQPLDSLASSHTQIRKHPDPRVMRRNSGGERWNGSELPHRR